MAGGCRLAWCPHGFITEQHEGRLVGPIVTVPEWMDEKHMVWVRGSRFAWDAGYIKIARHTLHELCRGRAWVTYQEWTPTLLIPRILPCSSDGHDVYRKFVNGSARIRALQRRFRRRRARRRAFMSLAHLSLSPDLRWHIATYA